MRRLFTPLLVVALVMFLIAPLLVVRAPYESTMGLVQKIFYFHVPAAFTMFLSAFVAGGAGAVFLLRGRPAADRIATAAAELCVLFGLIVMVTGPMWARKAWGIWWQWDARLTSTLVMWLVFQSYLLLRRYGGPGSDKLSAAVAVFGAALVPFVYWSVNMWRTVHPTTNVVPTLDASMRGPFYFCVFTFFALFGVLLAARSELEARRVQLDALYRGVDE